MSFGQREKQMFRLVKWLEQKLGTKVYELRDEKILKDRGRQTSDVISLDEITSWHVDYEMVFDIVTIQLRDGRMIQWLDKYNDLLDILRTKIKDKEK